MMRVIRCLVFVVFLSFLTMPIFTCSDNTGPKPPPPAPNLNDPGSVNYDGDYTISWSKPSNAESFTLQESDNSSFSNPNSLYSGPMSKHTIFDQPNGTYYYRVNSRNSNGKSGWSNVESITVDVPESISTPYDPSGPSNGEVGQNLTYYTLGSSSSFGHPIQYCIDWDDGSYSEWSNSMSTSHSYSEAGTYSIRARARCEIHTDVKSLWSYPKRVVIVDNVHEVSTPNTPSGPTIVFADQVNTYSTGGASCSKGHSVQYRFVWGNGEVSNWSNSSSAQYSWSGLGGYYVQAQARCAVDNSIISTWSLTIWVDVQEPETIDGSPYVCGSAGVRVDTDGLWWACVVPSSSLGHELEYQIDWDDGTYSSWSTDSQRHSYSVAGTYYLRARARCRIHTNVVSGWGPSAEVEVLPK